MTSSIFLSVICLSVIQGVTEWLPISSSGLLVIFEELVMLKDKNQNLLFNIATHTGSLIAVIIYFKKELFNIINNMSLILNITIATIPVIIFRFLVKFFTIGYHHPSISECT